MRSESSHDSFGETISLTKKTYVRKQNLEQDRIGGAKHTLKHTRAHTGLGMMKLT